LIRPVPRLVIYKTFVPLPSKIIAKLVDVSAKTGIFPFAQITAIPDDRLAILISSHAEVHMIENLDSRSAHHQVLTLFRGCFVFE
jgi:hypothetical protein